MTRQWTTIQHKPLSTKSIIIAKEGKRERERKRETLSNNYSV